MNHQNAVNPLVQLSIKGETVAGLVPAGTLLLLGLVFLGQPRFTV